MELSDASNRLRRYVLTISLNFAIKVSISHKAFLGLLQAQLLITSVPHTCMLNLAEMCHNIC